MGVYVSSIYFYDFSITLPKTYWSRSSIHSLSVELLSRPDNQNEMIVGEDKDHEWYDVHDDQVGQKRVTYHVVRVSS